MREFMEEFDAMGRGENFSYEGLCALYDHILDVEDQCHYEYKLDVIGLCWDFTEYATFDEFKSDHDWIDVRSWDEVEDFAYVIYVSDDCRIVGATL